MNQSNIDTILFKYWGYSSFRPLQREIIDSVTSGRDTLALLPTGGGKSLTYQVPALALDGVCLVITPLIALMKDQVDGLRRRAIPAEAIHSGMTLRQIDIALNNCEYGDTKLLYISPERAASDIFRMRLRSINISMIAVDEAHCISQWGYDFRPSYLRLGELREVVGRVPILALTASATSMVVEDIMTRLKFRAGNVLRGNFSRPNLSYAVRHTDDKNGQLMRIIESVQGSGIVYARTREGCEQISEFLREQGVSCSFYHGGLPHLERSIRQDEWMSGKVRVICATNAFGMGIDKPDVRFVVHYTMCDSLEAYYQEAGRAGRDLKRSYAVLLVASDDKERVKKRFEMEFPSLDSVKEIYDQVCAYLQIAFGEGGETTYLFNIYEFCAKHKTFTGTAVSAIKLLELNGYLTLSDEVNNPARIMFTVSRDDLYRVRIGNQELDHFIRVVLRLYDGLFCDFRKINEIEIAHWTGYSVERVKELFKRMWQMRIIRYIPSARSPLLTLTVDRQPLAAIYISPESYMVRKELYYKRFDNMIAYAFNTLKCRSTLLEEYFGSVDPVSCKVCDVCLEAKRSGRVVDVVLSAQIVEVLRAKPLCVKDLAVELKSSPELVTPYVDKLLAAGTITSNLGGELILK